METITEYYLEPGYSIFLEWGWNTPSGVGGIVPSTANAIAKYQSSFETDKKREDSGGQYDNYLGFITGGSVAIDGDKWTISVKCTGFTELPAYLLTSETGNQNEGKEAKSNSATLFGSGWLEANAKNYITEEVSTYSPTEADTFITIKSGDYQRLIFAEP